MKVHVLARSQWVPAGIEQVFPFFQDAGNLVRITPPSLRFEILSPLPVDMHEGALIDYVVRVGLLPFRWTTLITRYNAPTSFVDVQLKGPYSYWHHDHEFISTRGGTEIRDTVHYALPAGPLGSLMHALLVKRKLQRIFDYRSTIIQELFTARV